MTPGWDARTIFVMGGTASRAGRPLRCAAVLAAAITAALAPAPAATAFGEGQTQRSVVVLSDNASVKRYVREHGITPVFTYKEIFTGFAADLSAEQRAVLRQEAQVDGVSLARIVRHPPVTEPAGTFATAEPAATQSSELRSAPRVRADGSCGQVVPNAVLRVGALESRTARINCREDRDFSVGVAVLDSGIDAQHPDLHVAGGQQCVENATDPLSDIDGHGTAVAGLIGARDNGLGVVGVAPGVDLYAVKMFDDSGRSDLASALCALEWVAQNSARIDVANMSWVVLGRPSDLTSCAQQGTGASELLRVAICQIHRRGVVPVASVNNSFTDVGTGALPAAFPQPIAVSAIADFDGQPGGLAPAGDCFADEDDTFANFSDFGAAVDIAAPGVCNTTTAPIAACGVPLTVETGCYTTTVGTSFAAPLVAGAAALIRQRDPHATQNEVRRRLLAGAEPGPIPQDPDGFPEGVLSVRGT
jgi:subtilisin